MPFANSLNLRTTTNQIVVGAANNTTTGLATANNGALVTSSAGVPSISSTLPNAVLANINTIGASVTTQSAASAATTSFTVTNTHNTANSNSRLVINSQTGVAAYSYLVLSGGDPSPPGNTYSIMTGGLETGMTTRLGLGVAGAVLSRLSNAGIQTLPLQPAFSYYLNGAVTNVTGDGTVYVLGTDPLTAIFDQGANMTTAGVFTAPEDGVYHFDVVSTFNGIVAQTSAKIVGNFTSGTFSGPLVNALNANVAGDLVLNYSVTVQMTATDTAQFSVVSAGSTLTVGLAGGAYETYISGSKVA